MPTTEERWLAKVDTSGGPDACHPWTGSVNADQYGSFWDGTHRPSGAPRIVRAHRWGYQHFVGDPGDLLVLHTCDNPPCCNPRHWFLGTQLDNMADMIAKGRRGVIPTNVGTANPQAKLSEADVRAIRASNDTDSVLAARFGVSRSHISGIRTRKKWASIT